MLGNLRSITNKTMQETQKSKLGLVVEDGGVRAIYAAGVLDVLHDMCLPFSGVIGVSAGAIHGISFVSGQKGRSYRIYTRFCRDPRFFSFKTWLRTVIVDNDFCYRQIPQELEPFDQKNVRSFRHGILDSEHKFGDRKTRVHSYAGLLCRN